MALIRFGPPARLALGGVAGICAVLVSAPVRADDLVVYERAAVGTVAHEFDDGGPYLRAEILGIGDEVGFAVGVDFWHADGDAWGVGSPVTLHYVAFTEPVRLGLGGGFDFEHVDRLRGRTGVGLFAPLAVVELDVALGGVRLGVEGRAEYRWKTFGSAHEQGQLSAGITFAVPLEDP